VPDAPQDPTDDATAATAPAGSEPDATAARAVEPDTIKPLDVDGVRAIAVGTVLWTVALVVCLLAREQLADAGNSWWTWVCLTGALLGLPGLWYVRRRARAYARG
jgi:hypothetical protein